MNPDSSITKPCPECGKKAGCRIGPFRFQCVCGALLKNAEVGLSDDVPSAGGKYDGQ